jgi:ABC-type uncharacterized transport system involved in gliding motility auxiliary subunit
MLKQIAGIIGWIGVAIVAFAVGIKLEFYLPGWVPYINYLLAAALVCILIYMLGEWQDILSFFGKRQTRYGTMSLVSILVGLGIVVAINYLAVRQNKRWDLTENQAFSLSEQSVKVLKSLDSPLQFTVYDLDTNFGRFRDRLDSYAYESKNVKVEYVDIDRQPARAKQADVQTAGTIVVSYKDRTQKITNTEEQDITNALIKLENPQQKKVYFTQGHGEHDSAGSDRAGYTSIAAAIGRDNFTVEKLVLVQQKTTPPDATVIVIAGPKTDFLEPEIAALKVFLAKGGKLLVMLDPPELNGPDLTNIRAMLKDWSIEFGNDVVVDASGMGQMFGGDASVPVAASYPAHPITDNFRVMTAFPLSRSVKATEGGANGKTPQMLVETSAQSWAETDLKSLASGKVEFNGDQGDKQGPVALGAAVSSPAAEAPPPAAGNASPDAPKPESRIVAFGDSDFAANNAIGIQGNQDFFLNALNWLAQQENQIAIRPKEPQDRRITLTATQQQRIWLLSIFIIPGLVLGAGAYTWWRRR